MSTKTVAFFDFDGTITTKDTLLDFAKYVHGKKVFYLGMLRIAPVLIAYKLGFYPNYKAKESFLTHFFGGMSCELFAKCSQAYSLNAIDKIVDAKMIEQLEWHKARGDRIVIVSASAKCWLLPWCERESLELLCTELECVDSVMTGKLSTPNCYGVEKVNRIKRHLDLNEYDNIFAYGDSNGDKQMLELVNC
jgi:phosphatidylglycerophosphatase C